MHQQQQIPFSWLGTVLIGREPIVESPFCKQIMTEHYDRICHKILDIVRSKNAPVIEAALMLIMPQLGAFRKDLFATKKFLSECMVFLERLLQERNRHAFVTVGLMAVAVGSHIQPFLPMILGHVRCSDES